MDQPRMLKKVYQSTSNTDPFLECLKELFNSVQSFHKLHLKLKGEGSYAAHKALQTIYEDLPDAIDSLYEGYQGATETLVSFVPTAPKELNNIQEALTHLRYLYSMLTKCQNSLTYSEIINDIDVVKSLINSTKYKLLFLK